MLKKILVFVLLLTVLLAGFFVMLLFGLSVIEALLIVLSVVIVATVIVLVRKLILYLIIVNKRKQDETQLNDSSDQLSFLRRIQASICNILGIRANNVAKKLLQLFKAVYNKNYSVSAYQNPWYVIIGEKHSGKTSLLQASGISVVSEQPESSIEQDGDSNFWFTDNATFIDVSGVVLQEADEEKHKSRWNDLLHSLLRHRIVEPINGVIITVSMADLLNKSASELEQSGAFNKRRINDILTTLHSPIYIYIVITHLDVVSGFSDCCSIAGDKIDKQVIGANNVNKNTQQFISASLQSSSFSMQELLFAALGKLNVTSKLLRLPEEMKGLDSALQSFIRGLLSGSYYKYTPRLQGLYLTGIKDTDSGGPKGLFSHELMRYRIPLERFHASNLNYPERLYVILRSFFSFRWKNIIASLFIIFSALTGYNLFGLISDVDKYNNHKTVTGDFRSLEELRNIIINTHNTINSAWVPWFSWYVDEDFSDNMYAQYFKVFNQSFIEPTDIHFANKINSLVGSYVENSIYSKQDILALSEYAVHIIKRIYVMKHALSSETSVVENLLDMPPVLYTVSQMHNKYRGANLSDLNRQYFYALHWIGKDVLINEVEVLQSKLEKIIDFLTLDFEWILDVANAYISTEDFKLYNYWSGSKQVKDKYAVKGSYTTDGKEFVDEILMQLQYINVNDSLGEEIDLFKSKYRKNYFRNWHYFALNFSHGVQLLQNRSEWVMELSRLGLSNNPYFKAINTLKEQLVPFTEDEYSEDNPIWVDMLSYYEYIESINREQSVASKDTGGLIQKVKGMFLNNEVVKVANNMQIYERAQYKLFKKVGKSDDEIERDLKVSASELGKYISALKDISFNIGIKIVSYDSMKDLFSNSDNIGSGTSSLSKAYKSIQTLQFLTGSVNSDSKPFWSLYKGSADLAKQFMLRDSACLVNQLWESKFLAEVEGISADKLSDFMFGSSGLLWSFIDNHIKDFLSVKQGAVYAMKRVDDSSLAMKQDFLRFIIYGRSKAKKQEKKVKVDVQASPTNVNLGAMYFPEKTVVSLQCPNDIQVIENLNYKTQSAFRWNSKCTDVSVSIYISDLVLQKTYTGTDALYKFMKSFKNNHLRFQPKDFPVQEDELKFMDIKFVDLHYTFTGYYSMKQALLVAPSKPPKKIAMCWKI